jgi:hypothetical protein
MLTCYCGSGARFVLDLAMPGVSPHEVEHVDDGRPCVVRCSQHAGPFAVEVDDERPPVPLERPSCATPWDVPIPGGW